jgi:hypothetical protein
MKRRNSIAIQASGYTISGSFAAASAVCLLSGKGFSSMFYGALSAIAAAGTNELAEDIQPEQPDQPATAAVSSSPEPSKEGATAPTAS